MTIRLLAAAALEISLGDRPLPTGRGGPPIGAAS
jgi:hypothetical protein